MMLLLLLICLVVVLLIGFMETVGYEFWILHFLLALVGNLGRVGGIVASNCHVGN